MGVALPHDEFAAPMWIVYNPFHLERAGSVCETSFTYERLRLRPESKGVAMIRTGQRLRNRQTAGYVLLIISLLLIFLYSAATVRAGDRKKSAVLQATPTIRFTRTDYEVTEGNRATITVEINPSPTITATVRYETLNGTAQAGTDYIAASGFLGLCSWRYDEIFPGTNPFEKHVRGGQNGHPALE